MIVDGKKIAQEILARAQARAMKLCSAGRRTPLVVAVKGDDSPATRSYLKIKEKRAADAGCRFEVRELGASTDDADAVIVQLPLADGTDPKPILDAIPLEKDADVLSETAREKFEMDEFDALLPPVVAAIKEIFTRYQIDPKEKRVAVIGEGWLVGKPAATWLTNQGAQVETLNSKSDPASLKTADIIISGAGVPKLIKPEMLKPGVVLIDAATSESNGEIAGDADPACASVASLFTPVPGGVGPIAVACLFENVVTLAERAG